MRKLPVLALTLMALAGAAVALADAEPPGPVSELFPVEPGRNAERGFAVAVDGDWLAMGAPRDDADETAKDSGAVYLFHWSGTTWDQAAKLRADSPLPNAQLGFAVALRGDVLAAGAPGEGAVYVFALQDGVWEQVKKLTGTFHGAGAFGRSLALDTERLAVGAIGVPDTTGGAIYLYRRDSWALEQVVSPPPGAGQPGERFASAVSLAGGVLAVGAPGRDVGTGPPAADAGAVYVFQRGPFHWRGMAMLLPPPVAGQQFGSAVATDGAQVFVGAPTADLQGGNSGALYRFVQVAGGWGSRQDLPAAGLAAGDQLGASLALSGDLLVAGAPAPPPGKGTGRAHVFRHSGASWLEVEIPGARNAEVRDLAGFAVGVSGERVVVGGVLGDQGDGAAGATWSFRCPVDQPCAEEAEAVARDRSAGSVGVSVALTPRFLAVGAPRNDGVTAGVVYLYRRAGQAWRQEARLTTDDPADGFGSSVALDGERLLVGAPQGRLPPQSPELYFPGTRNGLVYLYSRQGGSWIVEDGFDPRPPAPGGEKFGTSVAIEGDVVAIGSPRVGQPGAVYVAEKTGDRWMQTGALTLASSAENFGAAVSLRGQLLAIGAPGEEGGIGAVHLATRDSSGRWTLAQKMPGTRPIISGAVDQGFGASVSLGDGLLAVGAPGSGTVSVFQAVGGGWQGLRRFPGPEDRAIPGLGTSLSLLGTRLAAGAPDLLGQGRAFLFDVESGGSREIMPLKSLAGDGFGAAVALSEDFSVVTSPGSTRHDRVTVFAEPHVMPEPR